MIASSGNNLENSVYPSPPTIPKEPVLAYSVASTTSVPKEPVSAYDASVTALQKSTASMLVPSKVKIPNDPASSSTTVTAAMSKDSQALMDLDKKEADEIQALQDKATDLRNKFLADMKISQDQVIALRAKYRLDRYTIMDRITPGSGTTLAKRDKGIADLETQFQKDMEALSTAQNADASKGTMTKDSQAKFQSDRKAIMDAYSTKKQELLSK